MSRRGLIEDLVQPLIVATMLGCVVLSLVAVVEASVPAWHGTYLVLFCALTVLEAFFTYRLYERHSLHIYGGTKFRLVEWAVLLVLLQLANDLTTRRPPLSGGLPRVDLLTLELFIPVLICWQIATLTARDLDQVRLHSQRVPGYEPPNDRLAGRFFAGGLLLFAAAAITQAQNARLVGLSHPGVSSPLLNVLLYFTLGMVLLGQIHRAALQARWREEGSALAGSLSGRWIRYSFLLLGAVGALAFLLPTGYAAGLLSAASSGSESVLTALWERFGDLLSALGLQPHGQLSRPPLLPAQPPRHLPPLPHGATPPTPHGGGDRFRIVRVVLFWLVTLGLVVYLLHGYLQPRRAQLRVPGPLRRIADLLARIGALLERFLSGARDTARRLAPTFRRPRRPTLASSRAAGHWLRLGALPPREQVVYYFLSVVQRAERLGVPRSRSHTALELEAEISPKLAEAQGEMHRLTQAYLEARYSRHPIDAASARATRRSWERVRAVLRAFRSS